MAVNIRSDEVYRAVCALTHKTEKLDPAVVASAYVDMGHIARIKNGTSQYIDGRRGTGKTHLLMYLADSVNLSVAEERALAIYADARELRLESGLTENEPKELAKRIFNQLLALTLERLRDLASQVLWHNDVPTARTPFDERAALNSRECLRALEKALHGRAIDVKKRTRTESSRNAQSLSLDGKVGAALSATPASPKLDISASSSLSGSINHQKQSDESSTLEYRLSYSDVRDAIEAFLDVNAIERLYLCLDEWSSVPLAAQAYVAEYIKRTFLPSPKIAVKLATLPFQTSFSRTDAGELLGFERNGDIFLGLDLDDELVYGRHPERALKLFPELLLNHLQHTIEKETGTRMHSGAANAFVERFFSDAAFERILIFSQGNPRDFLTLFKKSYLQFFDTESQKITTPFVENAAKEFGIEKIESIRENGPEEKLFNAIVREVLQGQRKNAFLVNTSYSAHPALLHLIHQRALHIWDRSYSSPSFAGERFMVLAIDHCIIVEHLKSPNYRQLLELPTGDGKSTSDSEPSDERRSLSLFEAERPDKRSVRYTVLSTKLLEQPRISSCRGCGREYAPDHPVVVRAKVCPNCGEGIS